MIDLKRKQNSSGRYQGPDDFKLSSFQDGSDMRYKAVKD
jgi:hypothetical protein